MSDALSKLISSTLDNLVVADNGGNLLSNTSIDNLLIKIEDSLINNLKPGDVLLINLDRNHKYLFVILICLKLGIAFVPTSTHFPKSRIDQIAKISNCDFILDNDNWDSFINPKSSKILKKTLLSAKVSTIAYIIFTSGSTGAPKGVVISRNAYLNFNKWVNEEFKEINHNDRLLNVVEFSFDMSLLDVALLISRNVQFFFSTFDSNFFQMACEIEKYAISTLVTVPNNANIIFQPMILAKADFSKLRYLLLGGARFSSGLYSSLNKINKSMVIYNLYGPTEATVYCSCKRLYVDNNDIDKGVVSAGAANFNSEILIVDEDSLELLEFGDKGEVLIGGNQLMTEYMKDSEKTRDVLISQNGKKYYKTGDLGFLSKKGGGLFLVGRADDTIKVSGYRVNLSDIDSYISDSDLVIECATVAIEDNNKEHLLVAFVNLLDKSGLIIDLKEDLRARLLHYQVPSKIISVEKFPVNSSGKICKNTLKANYKNSVH
jgi:D-alanine--poly(phosphoribitol) ligase subunit 1